MAPCRPNLKTHPGARLVHSWFADSSWRGVVRPWLAAGSGRLCRSLVVAPTRGQTQALKQRCAEEGLALLGTEFLTPALARKRRGAPEGPPRALQALLLRDHVARRIAAVDGEDPSRGVWKSLGSDIDAALSDFEELARAGFGPDSFARPELREAFVAMESRLSALGYEIEARRDAADAAAGPGTGLAVADRLLVLAGGAEGWRDFRGLVALAWRCPEVTVLAAEPDFKKRQTDEEWMAAWESALGIAQEPVDADPPDGCGAVGEAWDGPDGSAERADFIIAASRSEEAAHAADAAERLLSSGSPNIAVIVPGLGPAHSRIASHLEGRGIPFADLVGEAGAPSIEARIQHALARFYEKGCRMEELLALWPMLRHLGLAELSPGQARAGCQRLFDEYQSSALGPRLDRLAADGGHPAWREIGRVAALLLPAWPAELTASDAAGRFERACAALSVGEPPGWGPLRAFASRCPDPFPLAAVIGAIRAFLPGAVPAEGGRGRGTFARVTLTTCRRATGAAWSDVILVESNHGVWPRTEESSAWLDDDERRRLEKSAGRVSLALPALDARADNERRMYRTIARDTSGRILFTASLFNEENPETPLAPNPWLERVLWAKGALSGKRGRDSGFAALAAPRPAPPAGPVPPPAGWLRVWGRRRDPSAPFDEYFLGGPRGKEPASFTAKQMERGVADPAVLWFDGVLRISRVEWRPFARAEGRAVGEFVHGALSKALRGAPAEGHFSALPSEAEAQEELSRQLEALRSRWPADAYWDSFHRGVARSARELLRRLYHLTPEARPFAGVEIRLPDTASVPVGGGRRIGVSGRMDIVLSEKPRWAGANLEIVDFKTGGDARINPKAMAKGRSLQLGVYLAAARSLGAAGNVWMLKPEESPSKISSDEVESACQALEIIGRHLASGVYGAKTGDRTDFTHEFEWPLACVPIAAAVLDAKFAATFGGEAEQNAEEAEDAEDA